MGIRPDDSRSPSNQILADLRRSIATGAVGPGDKLPSNAELRQRYGVANQTAQNAINALKAEGIIYSVPGRGVFVRSDLDADALLERMARAEPDSPVYEEILAQLEQIGDAIAVINGRLDELERHRTVPSSDQNAG